MNLAGMGKHDLSCVHAYSHFSHSFTSYASPAVRFASVSHRLYKLAVVHTFGMSALSTEGAAQMAKMTARVKVTMNRNQAFGISGHRRSDPQERYLLPLTSLHFGILWFDWYTV